MNRRSFLNSLVAAVGGVALDQAIPFGRVWSFPSKVKVISANTGDLSRRRGLAFWYEANEILMPAMGQW